MSASSVIWHELECGRYRADLRLWHELASAARGPVLEIGAGAGRVALELARAGHQVTALDRDAELLAALRVACDGLAVRTVCADARSFSLPGRFALCVVAMQTIQLLGGREGRMAFLRCAAGHLLAGGRLAAAIVERIEPFELIDAAPGPPPEVCQRDGRLYRSQPTAVRALDDCFVLQRRREVLAPDGQRWVSHDTVHLDRLDARTLDCELEAAGLHAREHRRIPATAEHVGSVVVIAGG
jgi:SAM-dependent methyltransferase